MKYIYISQFDDNCGYGSAARGYLESLATVLDNSKLAIYSVSLESNMSHLSNEEKLMLDKYRLQNIQDINEFLKNDDYCLIWHMPPSMMEIIHKNSKETSFEKENKWHNSVFLLKNSKKNINISAWEADKIPEDWISIFKNRKTSAVIVPSEWNYNVYGKDIKNVYCIPHYIRTPTVDTKKINLPLDITNKFVIFSMSQWDIRKGFDSLIKSYVMEFKDQEDVVLIIKTYGIIVDAFKHMQEQQKNNIIKEISDYKKAVILKDNKTPSCKILPIIGPIEYEKINYLYDVSNLFALATRGEGFGLTIAEAFLKNKKILVPSEGGHIDFLKGDSHVKYFKGYWSPYMFKPGYDCDMNWFEPDLLSLRSKLRQSYEEWKLEGDKSISKRNIMSKSEISEKILKVLKDIENGDNVA